MNSPRLQMLLLLGAAATLAERKDTMPSSACPSIRFQKSGTLRAVHANGASPAKHMIETMGSGVALLDFDGDGWLDIFLVPGASGRALLFRNEMAAQSFRDVSANSGLRLDGVHGMGVAVGDIDNDGLPDLYVTGYPRNYLFRNLGGGKFADVTASMRVAAGGWSTGAVFFDYDRDGRLDLYVGRYVDYRPDQEPYCGIRKDGWRSYCLPDVFRGISGILYRKRGGSFEDVTAAAGLLQPEAKTLGVAAGDYDRDGWTDLFVANDRVRNFLFRNTGHGGFQERAETHGGAYSEDGTTRAGMGADFGDFNNDGWPDILVTNFETEGAALFRNDKADRFEDIAARSELGRRTFLQVGFGAKFADLDNDGFTDVFVVNGHVIDNIALYKDSVSFRQPKQVFRNLGSAGFRWCSDAVIGIPEGVGRGLALGDIDNDGDLDALVTNNGGAAELLRNVSTPKGNWIGFQLEGKPSNREAIGARVELWSAGRMQVREISRGGSYLSAHDVRAHFGLGAARSVDRVLIHWPSGKVQELLQPQPGRLHRISEESGAK